MFANSARSELRIYQDRLKGWQESVAPRARRFHGAREDLERRIDALLGRWWQLWISGDELERMRDQIARLESVAPGLEKLIESALRLEDEARQLRDRAPDVGDVELAAWLAQRARQWLIRAEHAGTNCDRRPELFQDEQILAETEAELRLHSEASYWLEEARNVLEELGSDAHAAELAAALPDIRQQLFHSGASPVWLADLRQRIKPLKERLARISDPPEALQTVAGQLTDLRGWSRQLHKMESEVIELERQHRRFVAVEWTEEQPEEVRELARQATALRSQLIAMGADERRLELEGLERGILDLAQACGPQPGLEKKLAEVQSSHQTLQRHHQHADWLRQFGGARDAFQGIAETKQLALEERLGSLLGKLSQRIEALRAQPISSEIERRVDEIEHDISEMASGRRVEQILSHLRLAPDLESRLAALEEELRQVGEAIGRLDRRRQATQLQLAALQLEHLAPGDRQDAEQLLVELEDGSWSHAKDDFERLRLLSQLAEKCELFFARLQQEQIDTEQRLVGLRRRLQRFNEAQLRRYVPGLSERVTALVYGVPDPPRQWPAVARQLAAAETLFDRLERQAERLAARDLEQAAANLSRQAEGVAGEPRETARALLAELEACGHDALPPVTLRMRLLNAAPRGTRR